MVWPYVYKTAVPAILGYETVASLWPEYTIIALLLLNFAVVVAAVIGFRKEIHQIRGEMLALGKLTKPA